MRKGEKEGKICLPTLAFRLTSYSLMDVWIGGSLCPAPFLLFNLLVCFSQKRERETLCDSLRLCGTLQIVWK